VRNPFSRGPKPPADVVGRAALGRGDAVLASARTAEGGWLLGTREALVVVSAGGTVRIPWEQVETADWDRDDERLRVVEVGEFGIERPVHVFTLADPARLLQMIRERVTASVVLQRRVVVSGKRGLNVVGRRAPRGDGEISWACEFDLGVDPSDPTVRAAAEEGLRAAQAEVGTERRPI
jgi:hypothetical protein